MQLHYRLKALHVTQKCIVVLLHGLFGNLSNLGVMATYLSKYYNIVQVDLRNHGKSPHINIMTYFDMAQDILDTLDLLSIDKCIVIGHSMGGKVAMMLCILFPQRIIKSIIIDIAPISYDMHHHNYIFNAIESVINTEIQDRNEAMKLMQKYITDEKLILFLLKSFCQGSWNFNFCSIKKNYQHISNWYTYQTYWGPILFIKGELSSYIDDVYLCDIYHQFPRAKIYKIPHTGHWVHVENPSQVVSIIKDFIF